MSAATLMLEILLTRITSVIGWYHMAFFVISLAMLGMTVGAVTVFLASRRFTPQRAPRIMGTATVWFAISGSVSLAIALFIPLVHAGFFGLLGYGTLLAIPFAASGVALTVALTRAGLPPGLIYGIDLCGAATGCAAVIPLLAAVDAPSAALLTAGLAALGALLLHSDARGRTTASAVATVLLAAGILNSLVDPSPLRPRWVKGLHADVEKLAYVGWNTHSRVSVEQTSIHPPGLWAPSTKMPARLARPIPQRGIYIDGAAGTLMSRLDTTPNDDRPPDLDDHAYLAWDVTSFAHRLRDSGPAAIIGVGGGRDVLEAVRVGHNPVVGIELNALIVRLHRHTMADFSGLLTLPAVRLVTDEARSYLARDTQRYAVITMSLIDTWASTGAGAYSLSENSLYTIEAWQTFLHRLQPNGIFTVSRWYKPDSPGETGRMLGLALATLWERGVQDPRRHIILVQNMNIATLLVSPRPFSDADLDRAQAEAATRGYNMLATPRRLPTNPVLRDILARDSLPELLAWSDDQPLDYSPPTDRRPFFFNMLKPSTWLRSPELVDELDHQFLGNLRATQVLVQAVAVSLCLTVAAVGIPLWLRRKSLQTVRRSHLLAATTYFALIGLGFMFVEIGLLSRLSILLGHPTLALAVLLGGVILFTGVGSLLSQRIALERPWVAKIYPLIPAVGITLVLFGLDPASRWFAGAGEAVRIAVALAAVAVPGLGMGLGFPLGLRLLDRNGHAELLGPWMWGINGACGVVASGLALACSMVWSTTATLAIGAGCYALLPWTTHWLAKR